VLKFKLPDTATFVGSRQHGKVVVEVKFTNGSSRPLKHVVHHSPTGFGVGYGGSGPADLALSILSAVISEKKSVPLLEGRCGRMAWDLHQDFKRDFVAWFSENWSLSVETVREWVESKNDGRSD